MKGSNRKLSIILLCIDETICFFNNLADIHRVSSIFKKVFTCISFCKKKGKTIFMTSVKRYNPLNNCDKHLVNNLRVKSIFTDMSESTTFKMYHSPSKPMILFLLLFLYLEVRSE